MTRTRPASASVATTIPTLVPHAPVATRSSANSPRRSDAAIVTLPTGSYPGSDYMPNPVSPSQHDAAQVNPALSNPVTEPFLERLFASEELAKEVYDKHAPIARCLLPDEGNEFHKMLTDLLEIVDTPERRFKNYAEAALVPQLRAETKLLFKSIMNVLDAAEWLGFRRFVKKRTRTRVKRDADQTHKTAMKEENPAASTSSAARRKRKMRAPKDLDPNAELSSSGSLRDE